MKEFNALMKQQFIKEKKVNYKEEVGVSERQGCCCQSRSLSRIETQDIKTQPQFNHYLDVFLFFWLNSFLFSFLGLFLSA